MANGRFLSNSIRDDYRLNNLSLESEYLFLKTIPHLNRDGIILSDTLWATVCPRRKQLFAEIDNLVSEWIGCGLVIKYATFEGDALFFPAFLRNQQGLKWSREKPSKYPLPDGWIHSPGDSKDSMQIVRDGNPELVRSQSGVGAAQVQEQEQVQDQGKGREIPAPLPQKPLNREQRRAQSNIAEAAKIGMDAPHLREWSDWVLEQADQLDIADVAEDDSRIGKAQQTAIAIWRLGFCQQEQLQDIRDWLDASYMEPPYYPANVENAASAICRGRNPPGSKATDVPASIRSLYNVAMEGQ